MNNKLFATKIENIYVTEDGRVWDEAKQKWATIYFNKSNRYHFISVNRLAPINLHRLMCETFHGEPVGDVKFVDHKDDNRNNNHKDNLQWTTRKVNNAKSTKARLANKREARLTTEQLDDMFTQYLTGQYTLTGITQYMNEKYGRNSLKPTYSQNLRGHCSKSYWEAQPEDVKAAILAITDGNRVNYNI